MGAASLRIFSRHPSVQLLPFSASPSPLSPYLPSRSVVGRSDCSERWRGWDSPSPRSPAYPPFQPPYGTGSDSIITLVRARRAARSLFLSADAGCDCATPRCIAVNDAIAARAGIRFSFSAERWIFTDSFLELSLKSFLFYFRDVHEFGNWEELVQGWFRVNFSFFLFIS